LKTIDPPLRPGNAHIHANTHHLLLRRTIDIDHSQPIILPNTSFSPHTPPCRHQSMSHLIRRHLPTLTSRYPTIPPSPSHSYLPLPNNTACTSNPASCVSDVALRIPTSARRAVPCSPPAVTPKKCSYMRFLAVTYRVPQVRIDVEAGRKWAGN
jgi:hypothetical protein